MIEAPEEIIKTLLDFLKEEKLLEEFRKAFHNSKKRHELLLNDPYRYRMDMAVDLAINWEINDEVIWYDVQNKYREFARKNNYNITKYLITVEQVEKIVVNSKSIGDIFKIVKAAKGINDGRI